MNQVAQDFISKEPRTFHFKMGRALASSLSGFVVGALVASIVWFVGVWYFQQAQQIGNLNAATQHSTAAVAPASK